AAPSNLSARPIAAMCRSAQSKTAGSGRLWSPLAGSARLGLGLGLGVEVGVEVGSRFWVGGWVPVGDQSDCRPTARRLASPCRLAWCGFAALCLLGWLTLPRAHVALHSSQS